MAFLRRPGRPAQTTQDATPARVTSRLLASALEDLSDRTERITVLDLGSGAAGTVEYFASLDCPTRLIFGDSQALLDVLPQAASEDEPYPFAKVVRAFTQHLGLEEQMPIDLILLWDYLHYFDLQTIEALSSALQPHIYSGTRGYGFGTLYNDRGINPYNYAIANESEVFMQPAAQASLPYGHSQQALGENFICLRISRGTLLQEGHLELLLEP